MRECFRAERMKYRRTSIKGMTVECRWSQWFWLRG